MTEARQFSTTVGGKTITFGTGKLAAQAGGAVTIRQADTFILATATMRVPREVDFFPLTVDTKRLYAGRHSGSFFGTARRKRHPDRPLAIDRSAALPWARNDDRYPHALSSGLDPARHSGDRGASCRAHIPTCLRGRRRWVRKGGRAVRIQPTTRNGNSDVDCGGRTKDAVLMVVTLQVEGGLVRRRATIALQA
jgi:hypothetical protein